MFGSLGYHSLKVPGSLSKRRLSSVQVQGHCGWSEFLTELPNTTHSSEPNMISFEEEIFEAMMVQQLTTPVLSFTLEFKPQCAHFFYSLVSPPQTPSPWRGMPVDCTTLVFRTSCGSWTSRREGNRSPSLMSTCSNLQPANYPIWNPITSTSRHSGQRPNVCVHIVMQTAVTSRN